MNNQTDNQNQEKQDFRFDVFISYRHSELDSAAAAYLHKALENYKIPKEIQEKIGKKKINRVFRDEEELGASSDLFTEIENSIKASEYLVVILSPRYKQSKWCLKEIEAFLKYRSRDNILAVIIEGEPYDVFPDILLEEGEPLALDIRAKDKKEMLKLAKDRLPRLVAPILGCTYDELYQRHRVYRMRRLAMRSALIAAVSLVFGAITIKQNIEINKNFIAKQENQSRYLAQTATDLLESGDRETALLVALEALPKSSTDDSRPYVAEARIALENALYTYRMDYYYNLHPVKNMEMDADSISVTDYNRDEDVMATMDNMGYIYVWDCATGERLIKITDYATEEFRLTGNHSLLVKTADSLYSVDYTNGQLQWQWQLQSCDNCYTGKLDWAYSPATGKVICTGTKLGWDVETSYHMAQTPDGPDYISEYNYSLSDSHVIYVLDAATGEFTTWSPDRIYADISQENGTKFEVKDIAISPDGSLVAFQMFESLSTSGEAGINHIYVFPIDGGNPVYTAENPAYWVLNHLYWYSDSRLVSVYSDDTSVLCLGIVEHPFDWNVDCHDISTGEKLWSVAERSMSLSFNFDIRPFEAYNSRNELRQCIGVTGGNVYISIDRNTGEVYSRIEDRSRIMLAQVLPNKTSMLFITQDGCVFVTHPLDDKIYNPVLNSLIYYLNIDILSQVCRYNGRTYVFDGSSIHWYQDNIDENFEWMGSAPSMVGFSDSSRYMWFISHDSNIHLFDVNSGEQLWQDDATNSINYEYNGIIVQDRYLAYPSKETNTVSVYDIETSTVQDYPLNGIYGADYEIFLGAINTQQTLIPAYITSQHTGPAKSYFDAERADFNVLWVKDITTGEDTASFSANQLISALDCEEPLLYFTVKNAVLSGDGKYLLIPVDAVMADEDGNELPAEGRMLVWDMANSLWISLPQEAVDTLPSGMSYYRQDGWIMPGTSLINMYGTDGSIKIVDIAGSQVLHSLDFGVVGSTEISFTPDGDHIIMQDGGYRLKVYNWRTGEYTMEKTTGEFSSLEFKFYDEGRLLSARLTVSRYISNMVQMYDLEEAGVYKLQNTIGPCIACNGATTVVADNEYSRFYPYYSFDQLIEMARDILGDRQLTAAERQTYLID